MTIINAMRTPYNVPLGLSNKSIIKGAAMFETFEPAITQPFNKVSVYDALVPHWCIYLLIWNDFRLPAVCFFLSKFSRLCEETLWPKREWDWWHALSRLFPYSATTI